MEQAKVTKGTPEEARYLGADGLDEINQRLEGKPPQEVLAWAFQEFGEDIVMACSFGGTSGMALLDMAVKINPKVQVFYLDTDFLFPETYALTDEVAKRYGIQPLAFKSRLTPEEQAQQYGEALWSRDPDQCCALRKVEPNRRALEGKRAWISGIRRDQSKTRRNVRTVEWDSQFGLIKINPMAEWNEAQVREYIFMNEVPYNPLQDQGYPSIGCTYCTRKVKAGEDARAGRWSGFDKKECGLHLPGTFPDFESPLPCEGRGDSKSNQEQELTSMPRNNRVEERGVTIWFTGLSGAGKSTIANQLVKRLRTAGKKVELLDGDVVRTNLSKGLGFSKEDRDTNIRRIGFVSKLLTRNGVAAIVAAISPYREVRDEVRADIGDFVEVYVQCSLDELVRRDVKGLYVKAIKGELANFTGVSDPYEEPLNAEVVVNSERETEEESLGKVLDKLVEKGYLGREAVSANGKGT